MPKNRSDEIDELRRAVSDLTKLIEAKAKEAPPPANGGKETMVTLTARVPKYMVPALNHRGPTRSQALRDILEIALVDDKAALEADEKTGTGRRKGR
jgi:hypothetical protein